MFLCEIKTQKTFQDIAPNHSLVLGNSDGKKRTAERQQVSGTIASRVATSPDAVVWNPFGDRASLRPDG